MTDKTDLDANEPTARFKDVLDCVIHHPRLSNGAKFLALLRLHAALTTAIGRIGSIAPTKAPELYAKRVGRDESPIGFVRRVYAPWLEQGLTLADLARLDPKLDMSLRVFICTKGKPKDFDLPTKSGQIDQFIAALDLEGSSKAGNLIIRRIQEAHRIRKRKARRRRKVRAA